MMRVLTLPTDFFRKYGAGELAGRIQDISGLCGVLLEMAVAAGMALIFLAVYLAQISVYAPALVLPVLVILFLLMGHAAAQAAVQTRLGLEKRELSAKESGLVYAMFSGIQKIKLSGAERRMFARWAGNYAERAGMEYNPSFFVKTEPVIRMGILLAGNIVIYYRAIRSGMSAADYMAFYAAYAMLTGAFSSLLGWPGYSPGSRPAMRWYVRSWRRRRRWLRRKRW